MPISPEKMDRAEEFNRPPPIKFLTSECLVPAEHPKNPGSKQKLPLPQEPGIVSGPLNL